MNEFSLENLLKLIGFYELDARGTILYRRGIDFSQPADADSSYTGRNFFTEIFTCQNISELCLRFDNFVASLISTENFPFSCEASGQMIALRVMLIRINQQSRAGITTTGDGRLFYLDLRRI